MCSVFQKVPFNFQSKYFNNFCHCIYEEVIDRELILPKSEFSKPCVCYDKIFLNIFDFIFIIEDLQLKYFVQLPKYLYIVQSDILTKESYGGQMFSLDQKLYCHNKSNQLFEIKPDGKLKCVNPQHYNISYYQYGGKVYATDQYQIYMVMSDLQLHPIFRLGRMEPGCVSFVYPGILVFRSSLYKCKYVVLNMVTQQIVVTAIDGFDYNDDNSLSRDIPPIIYNFSLKFKFNAGKLVLNRKHELKTIKLRQIQQLIYNQFESVNEMIRKTAVQSNFVAKKFLNAFIISDQ
ncbi:Hypothetical_protein [Hexamita inflata]|uniref:Hypothetical_protein n=1 Tax=Hexamita inflata TaxID=28002 RepID=A0ABP1JVG0_9EUKA